MDWPTHQQHAVILDTDPLATSRLSTLLAERGFVIHAAVDCSDAVSMLRALPNVHVLFMDAFAPEFDGLQMLVLIKKARSRAVPLILMSQTRFADDPSYLRKPISQVDLDRCLERAFQSVERKKRDMLVRRFSAPAINKMAIATRVVPETVETEIETPLQAVIHELWGLLDESYRDEEYKQAIIAVIKALSEIDLYRPPELPLETAWLSSEYESPRKEKSKPRIQQAQPAKSPNSANAGTASLRALSEISSSSSPSLLHSGEDCSSGADSILQQPLPTDITSFGFDALSLSKEDMILCVVRMFCELGLLKHFKISPSKLVALLQLLASDHYHSSNPYHNFSHAVDVTQCVFAMLTRVAVALPNYFSMNDLLAVMIAAVFHDADHPGTNNAFLVATGHEWALLYNDQAVLENHSSAVCFRIMASNSAVNILSALSPSDFAEVRKTIISCILITDMTRHFELVSKYQTRARDERLLLLQVLLKCSDISNVVRPCEVYQKWAFRVADEFFAQGDREKNLGMQVAPMMDREMASIPEMQGNFIEFVAAPLFRLLTTEFPQMQELLTNLEHNREMFNKRRASRISLTMQQA